MTLTQDARTWPEPEARRIHRSKVSYLPDPIPVKPMSVREVLRSTAAVKALRALRRHGEKSVQFIRAYRSRWLRA